MASGWPPSGRDLLGLAIASRTGQFVFLSRPEGPGVPMGFQQVPEPKVVKNRAHVDLVVDDKEATQRWIEAHGGHKIEQHSLGDFTWFRMADPEGNEFCIHE